jgi:hypothetical protein
MVSLRSNPRLFTLLVLATLWAGALVVGGLWAMGPYADEYPTHAPVSRQVGLGLIFAGNFVFAYLVADRLFPRASKRVTWVVEGLCGACFIFCALSASLRLLGVLA